MTWLFRSVPQQPGRVDHARRIRELEMISGKIIRAGLAGQYHSAFHGRGVEFSQVREYQPGDDVRTIDWNVTARSGTPHVKQFVEERDLSIMLAVDVSGSMGFGSLDRSKLDLAVELASVIAFAAEQNQDRVGLAVFSEKTLTFMPPRRGRGTARMLTRKLLATLPRAGGTSNLQALSRKLDALLVKKSIVVLISDLLEMPFEDSLKRLSARHDLVAICIRDRREDRLPKRGLLRLRDLETGQARVIDLARTDAAEQIAILSASTEAELKSARVDQLVVSTSDDYEYRLVQFFKRRAALRHHR